MALFFPLQIFCSHPTTFVFHPTTFSAYLHLDCKDSTQTQQCTEIIWFKLTVKITCTISGSRNSTLSVIILPLGRFSPLYRSLNLKWIIVLLSLWESFLYSVVQDIFMTLWTIALVYV